MVLRMLWLQRHSAWAPVPLRLALGFLFLSHGYVKLFGDFGAVVNFFTSVGVPAPSFFVLVVGLVELVGGILLVLGGLVRLSSLLLVIDMLLALFLVGFSKSYLGGWEFELLLLGGCLTLLLSGAGRWSLDKDDQGPVGM
ncbi:MAG: DoxX family protein [bacterium]